MKSLKKKLLESLIFSKICISHSISLTDISHFKLLLGQRPNFFSLVNPFFLKISLKTNLLALETCLANKSKIIIVANITDPVLFKKFFYICKNKNILLIKNSDISLGFLTTRRINNIVLLTLFLSPLKMEIVQKEAALLRLPIISFGSLLTCNQSNLFYTGGNFSLFQVQNLILTLLTLCLKKKNGFTQNTPAFKKLFKK